MQPVQPQAGEFSWYPAGQVFRGGTQGGTGPGQIGPSGLPASFVAPASGVEAQMGQPQGSGFGRYPPTQANMGHGTSGQTGVVSVPPASLVTPASGFGPQTGQPQGSGFGWNPPTQVSAGHATGRHGPFPPGPPVPLIPPAPTPSEPMVPPELPATIPPTPAAPAEPPTTPPVCPPLAAPPAPPGSSPGFRPAWLVQATPSGPPTRRTATPVDILNIGFSVCSTAASSMSSLAPPL